MTPEQWVETLKAVAELVRAAGPVIVELIKRFWPDREDPKK